MTFAIVGGFAFFAVLLFGAFFAGWWIGHDRGWADAQAFDRIQRIAASRNALQRYRDENQS